MTNLRIIPTIQTDEPFGAGFGDVPSPYMVITPEVPLSAKGLDCWTESIMGFMRLCKQGLGKVYFTPMVKHKRDMTKRKLYVADMRFWAPFLYREIDLIRPERIFIMGKDAANFLIPNFQRMDRDHGCLFTVEGKDIDPSLEHIGSIVMVPTYSLADVLKNKPAHAWMMRDLQRFHTVKVTVPEWEVLDDISTAPIPQNARVSVDTETTGLTLDSHIHMIGIGWEDDRAYIAHDPSPESMIGLFNKINETDSSAAFHNATFDLAQMATSCDRQLPKLRNRIHDSMIKAHISGDKAKSLKHLTTIYTDLPGPHSGGSFEDEQYLAEDVRSTHALQDVPSMNKAKGTYAEGLYHDLAPQFVDMRLRGVYLNRDMILDLLANGEQELAEATDALDQYGTGVNWNSPSQVVDIFHGMGIPLTVKTKAGDYSVAEGVIDELLKEFKEYPDVHGDHISFLENLLRYRAKSKLVSGFLRSYLDLLDEENLVYPDMVLLGTETGRLSCKKPNLQQVPKKSGFKLCFVPRWNDSRYNTAFAPGYYGLVDFAGAELRMAAIVSGDKQMAEFILSGDPHSQLCRLAYPDKIPSDATLEIIKKVYADWRKLSKKTTFAMMYGGTLKGIAWKNNVPVEQVAAVFDALRTHCPVFMNWVDRTKAECVRNRQISTIFGNIRSLEEKYLYEGDSGVERAGINMPIQGSAGILALVVLRKLNQLCYEHNTVSRPIFGVHDSILSEIAEHEFDLYGQFVQQAYMDIENSPIVESPVYEMLGITGDLEIGRNWANTEDTSDYTDILHSIPCDSRGIILAK